MGSRRRLGRISSMRISSVPGSLRQSGKRRFCKHSKHSQVSKYSKSGRSNESRLGKPNRNGKNSIPGLNRDSRNRRGEILEPNKGIPSIPFTPSSKPSYNPR